jgi:NAD(P) transhydrogenase subunit beta
MTNYYILAVIYLVGSITFILGLKMLSHPESARKGNLIAAFGMAIAIFGTIFLDKTIGNYLWIFGGIIIGTIVGTLAAKKVKMTAMPQMVSLFNGMGGACAAIISIVEYQKHDFAHGGWWTVATIMAGLIIGTVSFAGSMIAFGKLNGNIGDKVFPGQKYMSSASSALNVSTSVRSELSMTAGL